MDHQEIEKILDIILRNNDNALRFKALLQLSHKIFQTEKDFLISMRDVLKNKTSLTVEEITELRKAVESLISGINVLSGVFKRFLNKEYRIN